MLLSTQCSVSAPAACLPPSARHGSVTATEPRERRRHRAGRGRGSGAARRPSPGDTSAAAATAVVWVTISHVKCKFIDTGRGQLLSAPSLTPAPPPPHPSLLSHISRPAGEATPEPLMVPTHPRSRDSGGSIQTAGMLREEITETMGRTNNG